MPDTKELFDSIAPSYDRINDILSFGIHRFWRNKLLSFILPEQPQSMLDLCTGTGDILLLCATKVKSLQKAVGLDISPVMLELARRKFHKLSNHFSPLPQCEFQLHDVSSIPFPANTFDLVTVAFGIRNVPKIESTLAESCRILKPGGSLYVLEFGLPKNKLVALFYRAYLRFLLPCLGYIISKKTSPFYYLGSSALAFPCGPDFCALLKKSGFTTVSFYPLLLGICWLYQSRK